jgi:hypothetical protein
MQSHQRAVVNATPSLAVRQTTLTPTQVRRVPGHPPLISQIARAAAAHGTLRGVSVRLLPKGTLPHTQPGTSTVKERILSLAHLDGLSSLRKLSLCMPRKKGDSTPMFYPSPLVPLVGRLEALELLFEMLPEVAREVRRLLPAATSLGTLSLAAWPPGVAPPALDGLSALVGGAHARAVSLKETCTYDR